MTGYHLKKIVRQVKRADIYDYGVDKINSKFLSEKHQKYNSSKNLSLQKYEYSFDYSWLENTKFFFIGHRLGNVFLGGENTKKTFLNSLEDFDFFETDLTFTKDEILVLYHPTAADNKYNFYIKNFTLDEIIKEKQYIATFDDIVNILDQKNKFLILDAPENFEKIINYIDKNYSNTIKQKLIPQIYHSEQLHILHNKKFLGPIFTSYATKETTQEIIQFALDNKIKAVTLTPFRLNEIEIKKYNNNLLFFTHAVDNPFEAIEYKLKGISGIYSKILNKKNFNLISEINKNNYLLYSP
jgi:glycerophosphoryl diester phosphodiesterase